MAASSVNRARCASAEYVNGCRCSFAKGFRPAFAKPSAAIFSHFESCNASNHSPGSARGSRAGQSQCSEKAIRSSHGCA